MLEATTVNAWSRCPAIVDCIMSVTRAVQFVDTLTRWSPLDDFDDDFRVGKKMILRRFKEDFLCASE